MADPIDNATAPPSLRDLAASIVGEIVDPGNLLGIQTIISNTVLESTKDVIELHAKLSGVLLGKLFSAPLAAIESQDPALDEIAKAAIAVIAGERDMGAGGGRSATDDAASRIVRNLTGAGAPLEPSEEPAKAYLNEAARMAVQGWLLGWGVEVFSEVLPIVGGIENFARLGDSIESTMGIGRVSRRVLTPYVDTAVVTPLKWAINKQYRPELLSLSQAIRARLGGFITEDEWAETYARHGYSERYARAVMAESQKRQSVEDYELLIRVGRANRDQLLQALREQGYDLAGAEHEADLPQIKRLVAFERAMATDAVAAYAAGRITAFELEDFIDGATIDTQERNQLRELAEARRLLRRKSLSPAEARTAVEAGIASVRDYEQALRADGYDEDAIDTLILVLRKKLDDRATAEELKQQRAEERAREKAAREERARIRREDLERTRALRRRGTEIDLERAVVRGLIPVARYVEILRDDFDLDTVDILVELVEADRQAYVAEEAAADAAAQRGRQRGLNLADLRAAVTAGTLAVPEFRAALDRLGLASADADLLTATLQAQLRDRAAAQAARDQAAAAARGRSIDLGRFERLVRSGVRSLAAYDTLLQSLGFDDASRAAMRELLELQIAEDAAQRHQAAAAAAAARQKGLSLDQWRRAVLLGARTREAYQAMLVTQGFTTDAIGALLALLDADVADAEDARRRREAAGTAPDARRLPLATVADAARLGLVSVATYQARLEAAGYTPDDVAIELALLVTEIADVQAARTRRDQLAAAQVDRGLSLAQLARAVRLERAPIDAYRARAVALGYAAADVALLVSVLDAETAQARATRARRAALVAAPTPDAAALAAVLAQADTGSLAGAALRTALEAQGLSADDVDLLLALAADERAARET